MKRIICLILALSMCLSITACGSSDSPEPTEPDSWIIDTQYVTDIMNQFMVSEDYQKMVLEFETAFHDSNATLNVRKPYVDAAIEYYMADPSFHLLILAVRGDFCWDDSYTNVMNIVYDLDTGIFYDSMLGHGGGFEVRYPEASGTAIESLLFRPKETYTTELVKEPLHTQYEVYHALNAEELAAVNDALGVEEPDEGIVYERLAPAEPENWVIDPQYIADILTEFMSTTGYQRMVTEFETAFHSDHATLIVRKPYVDAAIEHYVESEGTHLLILAVRGDFGFDNRLIIIYDLDTGLFFDRISESDPEQAAQYAAYEGKTQTMITAMPYDNIVNLEDGALLWTDAESYRMLNQEELAHVNQILDAEEPSDDILYESVPTQAPAEAPTEMPDEVPDDNPASLGNEGTVTAQSLADAARRFQSGKQYQEFSDDSSRIQIVAAFEYTMTNFEGHDVHVLVIRVDGVDTNMWGYSADTFLVDISTGNVWFEGNLDMNNWGDFSTPEDCFACIIGCSVWEQDGIWSEDETRTALPQSMIDGANNALS